MNISSTEYRGLKWGAVKPAQISEDKRKGEEATAFGPREAVVTCTGEQADLQTAPAREQTGTVSRGAHVQPV